MSERKRYWTEREREKEWERESGREKEREVEEKKIPESFDC
jgi:hypothetical protein